MAACIRNKLFLEDFAEHQLPLQAYLTVTPVTWMGRKVDARVMAKEDPSDLHRHVYSTILSVSKFCTCMHEECGLLCLAPTQGCFAM